MLDRLPLLWCTLSVAASVFGGLLTFGFLTETPNLGLSIMAAAIVGYALGAGEVVWITLFKRQFGVAAFPTTYGIFYFSLQLGFAAGGLVGGWSMDHIGLHGFLLICALLYLAPAALSIWRPGGKNLVSPA
jgi:predicted MFS family arabinose efflux permease